MRERGKIIVVGFSTVLVVVLLMGAVLGQERDSKEPYRPLAVLSEVLSRIQSDYVEDPNFSKVTEGALHGLVESLDSYSSYLTPEEYQEHQKGPQGQASIGAVVSKRWGTATIVSLLPGGPADRAGLQPGDGIELIDDRTTREMSYAEISSRLSGAPGSSITVSVVRERAQEPLPIPLTRELPKYPAVEGRIVEADIGYIKVAALPQGHARQVAAKITELRQNGAAKFVLDLRDSAVGDVEEGSEVANLFIRRGLIGYLTGQQYPRKSFLADEAKAVADEPLVVLVNQSTGGAAELAAAAIQDNRRGQLVGEPTFGIGSVQELITLEDGSALILSVAKYYSPSGKEIQDNGIVPDVLLRQEREFVSLLERDQPRPSTPRRDAVLQRAIELLNSQSSSAAREAA